MALETVAPPDTIESAGDEPAVLRTVELAQQRFAGPVGEYHRTGAYPQNPLGVWETGVNRALS